MSKDLLEAMKDLMGKEKTISFKDNKKETKYKLSQDKDNNEYTICIETNQKVKSNETLDREFEKIEKYFDNIEEKDYWPTTDEYPEMFRLWDASKSEDEVIRKSGATKYPEEWDNIMNTIKSLSDSNTEKKTSGSNKKELILEIIIVVLIIICLILLLH